MPAQHRTRSPRAKLGLALAGVLGLSLLVGGGVAATAGTSSTDVALLEKNSSGVTGDATATRSRVVATADGLDPDQRYYSYVYGAGASDSGANPCILTGERAAGPVNTVGRWQVDDDGHGTLTGTITLSKLDGGALSIREDDTGLHGAAGPTPADKLVGCGRIGTRPTTPAGTVQDQLPAVKVPATPTR